MKTPLTMRRTKKLGSEASARRTSPRSAACQSTGTITAGASIM